MVFKAERGYSGTSPGQSVPKLLARLTVRDLHIIIGPRVLPLLAASNRANETALRAAAERAIYHRPYAIFSDGDTRKTFLRNLDPGKLDELLHRLNKAGYCASKAELFLPDIVSSRAWPIWRSFFGLNEEATASSATALHQQIIEAKFSLFPHQRSVVRRAYARVEKGSGRTVIHMPTGSGKTRTAMHLVARVLNEVEPNLVVWLASSQELLEQAAETFETAWSALGNRSLHVQRFWGARTTIPEDLEDGIIVAGLAKLHAWREREAVAFLRLASRVRFVVMDEAHQAIAPTYREVIDGLCGAGDKGALLGLTATPGRSWNDISADQALSDFFGGSKVVLEIGEYSNPVQYLLDYKYLARPYFDQIDYAPELKPNSRDLQNLAKIDDYSEKMLEKFASDTARNLAIIDAIDKLLSRGHRRIILFAVSVEHAFDLAAAIAARGVFTAMVSGETVANRRASILRNFKSSSPEPQILCNFGVLTTGFDAPNTSAAVIARPTKSLVLFSQMVGRATRGPRAGGNETCDILTVHDPAYPGFGDIAEAFFNWEDVWNEC